MRVGGITAAGSRRKAAPSGGTDHGSSGGRIVGAALAVVLALAVALAALTGAGGRADAAGAPPAGEKLAGLTVRPAGSMDGYSREKFPHWSDAQEYDWKLPDGTPDPGSCDARDAALIRDGRDEVVRDGCYVERGRWFDPYTGNTYYAPGDIDIDHFVPLANAWRSGAKRWGPAKKERFANVPLDLLAVEDNANASKGDKGPEAWKPPRRAYWCKYSKKWINVKHHWELSVTGAEKRALKGMLGAC